MIMKSKNEPYRPFTLSKSRQKRVDNSDKIVKQRVKAVVAKQFSKKLIENATPPEIILIKALLEKKIHFFFQRRMVRHDKFYIVDFLIHCKHKKVIIELDGSQHYTPEGLSNDKNREEWIKANFNFESKRFKNHFIYNKLSSVMEWIEKQQPKVYSEIGSNGIKAVHRKLIKKLKLTQDGNLILNK